MILAWIGFQRLCRKKNKVCSILIKRRKNLLMLYLEHNNCKKKIPYSDNEKATNTRDKY